MEIDQSKIRLFKKINEKHFATDYSSDDWLYPPLFTWDKTKERDEIQNGKIFQNVSSGPYGLYIHLPFCLYKCAFCRQFSFAVSERKRYEDYTDLVIREMELYAPYFRHVQFSAIHLGGGTPTLFDLKKILESVYKNFLFSSSFSLNIEATPDSLNREKLLNLKKLGLTRLVIGVQSFDSAVLGAIERPRNQQEIFRKIYEEVKKAGIPNINIELVCGLPEQTFDSFIGDLEYIIGLRPDSIHLYPYFQTRLTVLGRNGVSLDPSRQDLIKKMREKGFLILKNRGYFYYGDDYVLNKMACNPITSMAHPFIIKGILALGVSSLGYHRLSSPLGIMRTFNTLDFKKYTEMLSQNLHPVEKFYYFNSLDEILRSILLKSCHRGYLSGEDFRNWDCEALKKFDLKRIHSRFKKEFLFLEKMGVARIDDSFSKITFDRGGAYPKIFYSPEVLKKCWQILNSKSL